ncbi:MAG: hypothetical protein HKO81_00200 [Flavobacteriaceae bacterium]|nr:hypothetical protein [Bacteroidia bacterium]NNL15044.1 hypothetical protein [Flavobacteriaceae bacterium]
MTFLNKRLFSILVLATLILLIPLLAMQFTNEVNWNIADFATAAFLLYGTGLLIEVVLRKTKIDYIKTIVIVTIVIVFLLIWAELAVGIFGSPFAGN